MRAFALLLVLASSTPLPVSAQPPAGRTADAILADYVTAIGGDKALRRHKTMHAKREVEIKGMNIRGTEERWATSAGKVLSVTNLTGVGTLRQGSNGRVRWAQDPINGLRILTGAEEESVRLESTWNAELQIKKLYRTVKVVDPPSPPPANTKVECLELTPKLGKPSIHCFDAETHLKVSQKGTQVSAQGEVPYTATMSDWREVGGVKIPHVEDATAGPMTFQTRLVEITFDEPVSAKLFEMPKAGKTDKAGKAPPAKTE
jgi:hypothetical protein